MAVVPIIISGREVKRPRIKKEMVKAEILREVARLEIALTTMPVPHQRRREENAKVMRWGIRAEMGIGSNLSD